MLQESAPRPVRSFEERAGSTDFLRLNDLFAAPAARPVAPPPEAPAAPPSEVPFGESLEPGWIEQASAALAGVEPSLEPTPDASDAVAPVAPMGPSAFEPAGWLLEAADAPTPQVPGRTLAPPPPGARPNLAAPRVEEPLAFPPAADSSAFVGEEPLVVEDDGIEEIQLDPLPTGAAEDGWLLGLDDAVLDHGLGPVGPGTEAAHLGPVALEASYCEPETRSRALSRVVAPAAAVVTLLAGSLGLLRFLAVGGDASAELQPVKIAPRPETVRLSPWEPAAERRGLDGAAAPSPEASTSRRPVARTRDAARAAEPGELMRGSRRARPANLPDPRDGASPAQPRLALSEATFHPASRSSATVRVASFQIGGVFEELFPDAQAGQRPAAAPERTAASRGEEEIVWVPLEEDAARRPNAETAPRASNPPTRSAAGESFLGELFPDAEQSGRAVVLATPEPRALPRPVEQDARSPFEDGLFVGAPEPAPTRSPEPVRGAATVDYLSELFPDATRQSAPVERPRVAVTDPIGQPAERSGATNVFEDGLFVGAVEEPAPGPTEVARPRERTVDYLAELFPDARETSPLRARPVEAPRVAVESPREHPASRPEKDLFEDGLFVGALAEAAPPRTAEVARPRERTVDYLAELFPDASATSVLPPAPVEAPRLAESTRAPSAPEPVEDGVAWQALEDERPEPALPAEPAAEPSAEVALVPPTVEAREPEPAPVEHRRVARRETKRPAPAPPARDAGPAAPAPIVPVVPIVPDVHPDAVAAEPEPVAALAPTPVAADEPQPVERVAEVAPDRAPPMPAPLIDAPPVRSAPRTSVDPAAVVDVATVEAPVEPPSGAPEPSGTVADSGPPQPADLATRQPESRGAKGEPPQARPGVRASIEPDLDPAGVHAETRSETVAIDDAPVALPTGDETPAATGVAAAEAPQEPEEPRSTGSSGLLRRRADDTEHWPGENIPLDLLGGPKRVLTPNVGDVRVVYQDGTVFRGKLFGLGMNIVWVETNLGRMTLEGKRIVRIERERQRDPEAGEPPAAVRVRVRTAGGVFVGQQLSRDGDKITIMTDEGYRVTLYSNDVETLSEGAEKAIGIRRRAE